MDIQEFYDNVEQHEDIEGVSISDKCGDLKFTVRHKPTQIKTEVHSDVIEGNKWADIRDVLECKREPHVLYHIARVCGYYSRTDNWNKSKMGELKARRNGNYQVASA